MRWSPHLDGLVLGREILGQGGASDGGDEDEQAGTGHELNAAHDGFL
jgi:hypothetical protein